MDEQSQMRGGEIKILSDVTVVDRTENQRDETMPDPLRLLDAHHSHRSEHSSEGH